MVNFILQKNGVFEKWNSGSFLGKKLGIVYAYRKKKESKIKGRMRELGKEREGERRKKRGEKGGGRSESDKGEEKKRKKKLMGSLCRYSIRVLNLKGTSYILETIGGTSQI